MSNEGQNLGRPEAKKADRFRDKRGETGQRVLVVAPGPFYWQGGVVQGAVADVVLVLLDTGVVWAFNRADLCNPCA